MKSKLFLLKFWLVACFSAFWLPLISQAVVVPRSPGSPAALPVPGESTFFGPAAAFTASGLIIMIIQVVLAIAGLVAVVFLIVGGFRYITASGNEEQVEGAKKTITHAIIGIVIIILSFVIVRIIANALAFGIV